MSGYTDWTVDFNFGALTTRVGCGMPFVYVTTNGSNPTVMFAGQPTVFANNGNFIGVSIANNNYGLFGPTGASTYTLGGFTPGSSHQLQLHFAEIVFTASQQRAFNVVINGVTVLTNFDIVVNAGAPNKAIEENFTATASSSGQIVIQFTTGFLTGLDGKLTRHTRSGSQKSSRAASAFQFGL